MISNDRPNYYGRQPYAQAKYNDAPRPEVAEDTLHVCNIDIDRKDFRLTLKENVRGRFLRIIENNGDRHESIMIPATGLEDFYAVFAQMVEAESEFLPALPTQAHQPEAPEAE